MKFIKLTRIFSLNIIYINSAYISHMYELVYDTEDKSIPYTIIALKQKHQYDVLETPEQIIAQIQGASSAHGVPD